MCEPVAGDARWQQVGVVVGEPVIAGMLNLCAVVINPHYFAVPVAHSTFRAVVFNVAMALAGWQLNLAVCALLARRQQEPCSRLLVELVVYGVLPERVFQHLFDRFPSLLFPAFPFRFVDRFCECQPNHVAGPGTSLSGPSGSGAPSIRFFSCCSSAIAAGVGVAGNSIGRASSAACSCCRLRCSAVSPSRYPVAIVC